MGLARPILLPAVLYGIGTGVGLYVCALGVSHVLRAHA